MRKIVYIETSIPSFYHDARADPAVVVRKQWTRDWWDNRSCDYDLVTSEIVLDELGRGDYPQKEEAISLVQSVPVLPMGDAVVEIAKTYVARRVMPADPPGDALHLALASYSRARWRARLHVRRTNAPGKCDFLLTWNCRHLANANKFEHIRNVNCMLGLFSPTLVTPLGLLGEEAPDGR